MRRIVIALSAVLCVWAGLAGSTVAAASAGMAEDSGAVVPRAKTVDLLASATTSVTSCAPDLSPPCEGRTYAGSVMTGFNFNEDYFWGYTQIGWWALLDFDLPGDLAGGTVNSATLRMYPSFLGLQVAQTEFRITALAGSWNPSTVTFATMPNHYYPTGMAWVSGSSLSVNSQAAWDVKTIVGKWANGTWAGTGLLLWDPNYLYPGSTSWRGSTFYGTGDSVANLYKPHLIIDYTPGGYTCHGEVATIVGDGGDNVLNGGPGKDVIVGLGGADRIDGGGGNDVICGGSGKDRIEGGPGNDYINGGSGKDTVVYSGAAWGVAVSLKAGTATGGAGTDTLKKVENVIGSGYGDTITGKKGKNRLVGKGGNDVLEGLGGNDVLLGSGGSDTAYGGAGDDRCKAEIEHDCER